MIHRYVTFALSAICLCSGAELTPGDEIKSATSRPNFVFFITDDISPEDLGVYGSQTIMTPNLDEIARGGLVFDCLGRPTPFTTSGPGRRHRFARRTPGGRTGPAPHHCPSRSLHG